MADLKQSLEKKGVSQDPLVSMPMSELRSMVESLHGDLRERMDELEQKVLRLSGRVAAELGVRDLEL